MVFSSLTFLFIFLPVTLIVYYVVPARFRNIVALASSIIFYSWGAPRLVFLLLFSSAFDYVISRRLVSAGSGKASSRKALLWLGVLSNISALLYFKYANFIAEECVRLFAALGMSEPHWTYVALPIGISFFTFQKISYLIDVYRGWANPARSLRDYMLYVILFPQLIAGPIVRYHDIAEQLVFRVCSPEKFTSGIWRFCRGLAKKVLIANVMGQIADKVFALSPAELPMTVAWLGILCYGFQIYFDFSGYSDMAIGIGRMMGFELLENFNCPYVARTVTEFWRRWHISLSNWMRDYLYVPLGGNKRGRARTFINLWVVFLFSGLWHGAAWNFVVWGAFHGLFISLERMVGLKRLARVPGLIATTSTFIIILFSWVLFRSPDLSHAASYMRSMLDPVIFGLSAPETISIVLSAHQGWIMAIAVIISFAPSLLPYSSSLAACLKSLEQQQSLPYFKYAGAMVLLVMSAAALSAGGFNPFIYFRF